MANSETISRSDHLKAMVKSEDLLEHLTKDHEAKSVPVARTGQAKLHQELHPAVAVVPAPAETPKANAEVAIPASQEIADLEATQELGPMTELEALRAQLAELQQARTQPAPKASYGPTEAKRDIFEMAITAIDSAFSAAVAADEKPDWLTVMSSEDAARVISQAIHHFPTNRDANGKRVWPAKTLPKPDRSSWR
jgi:hypothetical protein